jgi:hypothetical protein
LWKTGLGRQMWEVSSAAVGHIAILEWTCCCCCCCCSLCFVLITEYCHYDYYERAAIWQHCPLLFSLLLKSGSCQQRTGEVHASEDERFFREGLLTIQAFHRSDCSSRQKFNLVARQLQVAESCHAIPFRTIQQLTVT